MLIGLLSVSQPILAAETITPAQNNIQLAATTATENFSNSSEANAQSITLPIFLKTFYYFLSRITLLLSFLMVILAIYVYMGSNGDAKKLTKSKEYLSGAIIGLAAVALAYTFFEILNPKILNLG